MYVIFKDTPMMSLRVVLRRDKKEKTNTRGNEWRKNKPSKSREKDWIY